MLRLDFVRLVLSALLLCGLALTASAQTQAGAIKAVRVTGEVSRVVNGVKTAVTEGQPLVESDTIETGANASVVLVFMNGASINLAQNSRLAIEEFKMDPLAENIAVGNLQIEPSVSKTRLNLAYGEMVGNVKRLNRSSRYDVKTPVGAAGIRGTTFRIVLQVNPAGQIIVQVSTSEGRVIFDGSVQAATTGEASDTQAVEIPAGQEINATATVDPATNTVTAVQVAAAQPISEQAVQAITTAVTQAIQQATQTTTFTPTEQQQAAQQTSNPPAGGTPGAPTSEQPTDQPTTPQTPVIDTSTRSGSG